jgi:hypothetical protein
MRSFLLTLCGALCLSLSIMAEQPVFVDSLTKVTLPLPEKSNVTRFASFKKAEVDLPKSYLFIYSMKNEKNEKFSWERINQFDEKEKYGTLLRSQRFNQHMTAGSLLVEVGTSGNTLQEALAGARLFARAAGQEYLSRMEE